MLQTNNHVGHRAGTTRKTRMFKRMGMLLLALTTLGLGCAEPVDTIDTVQPHYTSKALFQGDWNYRQTIVDVPPEISFGFEGIQGALEKVRWEIKEDSVLAYRIHESIIGLDNDDTLEGGRYKGDPVAEFAIIKHFDIKREYNATTGEETNVIGENTSDRPWNEREYMRVDWKSNLYSGPVDLSFVVANAESSDYVRETEIFDPDHLQLTDDYIAITTAGTVTDGGATCWYSYGNGNCGSATVRVRLSFSKIDALEAEQYIPRSYEDRLRLKDADGRPIKTIQSSQRNATGNARQVELPCTDETLEALNRDNGVPGLTTIDDCRFASFDQFAAFGYFRTERYAYDRQVGGGNYENRKFFANQHKIWANPLTRNEDGELEPTPLAELQVKPIIYYLNVDFPEDLEEATGVVGNDWDAPFIESVAARLGGEAAWQANRTCEANGGSDCASAAADVKRSIQTIRAEIAEVSAGEDWMFLDTDVNKASGMFQIRRNTCSVGGIESYASKGSDYRSLVDQTIEDATNGDGLRDGNYERVCSGLTARSQLDSDLDDFVWQQIGDVRFNFVNWISNQQPRGPLGYGPSSADPETGRIFSGSAHVYGAAIDVYARNASDIVRAMNDDLDFDALISGASYAEWLAGPTRSFGDMNPTIDPADLQEMALRTGGDQDMEAMYGRFIMDDGAIDAGGFRRHMQRRLLNPLESDPITQHIGVAVNQGQERLAKLREQPMFRARLLSNQHMSLARALHGAVRDDGQEDAVEETALDMVFDPKAFADRTNARNKFFADNNVYMGSFLDDSIIGQALEMKGLDPDEVYRRIRNQIYRAVMLHEIGHTLGLTHNFEASYDALNYQDEFWDIRENNGQEDWDALRLPEYRYASIMDYGSRFNADTKGLGKYDHAAIKFAYGHHAEVFESEEVVDDIKLNILIRGYEQIPAMAGGIENIVKRIDVPIAQLVEERTAGIANNGELAQALFAPSGDQFWVDRQVPYLYCFDMFNGQPPCRTWDEGSSHVEVVKSAIQNYWNYYAFNNYRRGRNQSAFINGYFGRQQRLSDYMRYPFRYYYFYQQYDINLRNDFFAAAQIGLNFIIQVLGTPEPGAHCLRPGSNIYVPRGELSEAEQDECEVLRVAEGTGRSENLVLNTEYYNQIDYIGTYFDKINFMYYLADTSTAFFGVSNIGDRRNFSIGYYRLFRPELVKLTRDLMFSFLEEEEGESFSSFVSKAENSELELLPKALVGRSAFGQDPAEMTGMARVRAPVNYNMVWQSILLSSVFNTSTYDSQLDFIQYIAVQEVGSGDDRDLEGVVDLNGDGEPDVATFEHPKTHVIYRAAQTLDGLSISFELLTRANTFVETVWQPTQDLFEQEPSAENRSRVEMVSRQLEQYNDLMSDLRLLRAGMDWSR